MSTNAKLGLGTLLKQGVTTIAEVVSISGPGLKRDTIDATNMGSTAPGREYIFGLLDGGEVTLEVNFLPGDTTQQGLYHNMISGTTYLPFSIVWTDGTTWTFNAFVTAFQPTGKVEDKLSASITLKITGVPTLP